MNAKHLLPIIASVVLLAGCGSSGNTSRSNSGVTPPPVDTSKEIAGTDKPAGALNVAVFKGGFGIDFFQQAAQEFQQKNPGLTIDLTGDPRIWEQIQPQFVAGNPPDLMYPGWGLDVWSLIANSQLLALDKALDSPDYDGKGKWRDDFIPQLLDQGVVDGHTYFLPFFVNVQGWWYSPDLFKKNGWSVPKTFDDLIALCDKIKAKGIAPITFQGHYPYYMIEGFLLPWAYSVGGLQAVNDAQNLVPGAWKSPAMLQAATMIATLRDKGDFQQGAVGMTHTESQTQFVNDKAAMIPCGTWLHTEMLKVMPNGFRMDFFNPPAAAGGKGDPNFAFLTVEPWMVPTQGKNPNAAIQFYKYLTSLDEAKKFCEQKGTLMAIKGSDEVTIPPELTGAAGVYRAAKVIWSDPYRYWYPTMETDLEGAMTELLSGGETPQQFCDRAETDAQKIRDDGSIIKHKLAGP